MALTHAVKSLSGECLTTHNWEVNIGAGNGLVPPGNKPLPEPMLTQFLIIQCCQAIRRNSTTNQITHDFPMKISSPISDLQYIFTDHTFSPCSMRSPKLLHPLKELINGPITPLTVINEIIPQTFLVKLNLYDEGEDNLLNKMSN